MQPSVLGHDTTGQPITGYTPEQLEAALTEQRHAAAAAIDALFVRHEKARDWSGLVAATKSACKTAVLTLPISK